MPELNFRLMVITDGADGKLHATTKVALDAKEKIEKPAVLKVTGEAALTTIRDLGLAVGSVMMAVGKLTAGINKLLDSSLVQRQAQILSNLAFKEASKEMQAYASAMQNVTNFGDEEMLVMMAKMSTTYKLSKDEVKSLTPVILDFAEANKATGMTMETAYDLMGKALNGHSEMLGRYGIELDKTRLQTEGVSYLVETLGADYGGTAAALADLRTQNKNAWGDIQETVGTMLDVLIHPLLSGLKLLMDAFNSLPKGLQGLVAGLVIAVPVILAVATAVTTLMAAVVALKAAMNPVVGIISLVVGGLTAAGVAFAATQMKTDAYAATQKSLAAQIKETSTAVSVEAEKFSLLANQLLEFRSKSVLTREEKQNMQGVIRSINQNYGEYLGNINLETIGYNQLKTAITQANDALLNKMTTQVYEGLLSGQVQKLAEAKVALSQKMNDLLNLSVPSTQDNFLAVAYEQLKMLEGRFSDWKTNPTYLAIRNLYDQVKAESGGLKSATNEYNAAISNLKQLKSSGGSQSSTSSSSSTSDYDSQKKAYESLLKELASLRNTELVNLQADYAKKLAIIKQFAVAGSQEEITALTNLDAWKTAETAKINDKIATQEAEVLASKKKLDEDKFRGDIQYYSNLQQLGVSSYDALKQTMTEYYAWAKENLSKEEQAAILIQLRETNLRWGQAKQREYEELLALAAIRDDFASRDLELSNNTYTLQLIALDNYYASHHDKLIEAGITEQQIEQQKAKALTRLQLASASQASAGVGSILGGMADLQDKESESGFKAWKALALAQATVDMPSAAMAAYKSMAGIPIVGPALGIAAAAVAVATGLKNISAINKTKYEKKAEGGILSGPSHARGGTIIEAEGGEYVTRKARVAALGTRFMDFLNFAPLSNVMSSLGNFSIPMPSDSFAYATGGQVSGLSSNSSLANLFSSMISKLDEISAKLPIINHITVDPLSNNPVKISEIADTGRLLRSTI